MNSYFIDKIQKPNDEILLIVLGESKVFYIEIINFISDTFGQIIKDWKFYSKKSGWIHKVLLKKRNLFFITPYKGSFRLTFVFGEKAVNVIKDTDVSGKIIDELLNARKYVEGRGLSIDVNSDEIVEIIKKLITIKINN